MPVALDTTGTWVPDPAVATTGLTTLRGHRIAIGPDLSPRHAGQAADQHEPVSDTVNTGGAEDEPWINADCSRIWFRRDGVVYQAQAQ